MTSEMNPHQIRIPGPPDLPISETGAIQELNNINNSNRIIPQYIPSVEENISLPADDRSMDLPHINSDIAYGIPAHNQELEDNFTTVTYKKMPSTKYNDIKVQPAQPPNCKVFFKNMPINWSHKPIQKLFRHLTGETTYPIMYKDETGQPLGMGYVQFHNSANANKVLQHDTYKINGVEINVRPHETKAERDAKRNSYNIFIAGVPLSYTKDKVTKMVEEYVEGHVTTIELHTKGNSKHGFIKCDLTDPKEDPECTLEIKSGDYLISEIIIQKYDRRPSLKKKQSGAA